MKRSGILTPAIILFGILILFTLFIIFFPAMFGSLSSESSVGKYVGNSDAGNDTIKASNGLDNLMVGLYSAPANQGFVAFVIVAAVIVLLVVFRMITQKKK